MFSPLLFNRNFLAFNWNCFRLAWLLIYLGRRLFHIIGPLCCIAKDVSLVVAFGIVKLSLEYLVAYLCCIGENKPSNVLGIINNFDLYININIWCRFILYISNAPSFTNKGWEGVNLFSLKIILYACFCLQKSFLILV